MPCYPPASKASREVANLIEIKNPHTPEYGVKEFVCLSVCSSVIIYNLFCIIKTCPFVLNITLYDHVLCSLIKVLQTTNTLYLMYQTTEKEFKEAKI